MTAKPLSEDQMVHMVRNALLVAGHEMGHVGDHWPAVNATIHDLMKNWEDTKAKRNAIEEVKKYYENLIQELVTIRNGSAAELRGDMDDTIAEVRAIYRACFDEANDNLHIGDAELPEHIKRAMTIIDTLEEDNE